MAKEGDSFLLSESGKSFQNGGEDVPKHGLLFPSWANKKVVIGLIVIFFMFIFAALIAAIPVAILFPDSDDEDDVANVWPLVIATWAMEGATEAAWAQLKTTGKTSLDAVEAGCNLCESDPAECNFIVGYGGKPNEDGQVTLDAMIMWGPTREVGAVGCLKNVKLASSVARSVMEKTYHSLLVGDDATKFAIQEGFVSESLETNRTDTEYADWVANGKVPNFWKSGVVPDSSFKRADARRNAYPLIDEFNHDTIGILAIDENGDLSCAVSTNGLRWKIAGRVGDSPLAGSGCYVDNEVGAVAATGNGDIIQRFAASRHAVTLMRLGRSPQAAIIEALDEIATLYPSESAALIAINKDGEYAAGFVGYTTFPFTLRSPQLSSSTVYQVTMPVS
eukprot:TRINITY_DN10136_c0_g1_i1.p1 TRINITY_DN10136_c0_g1~~TRINITY_DN10136_c0_g1_i1.p1  ORF type:complete len:392 (+),score=56.54 TRINITY_DN10136_c0_g1_i1:8-1183(+)